MLHLRKTQELALRHIAARLVAGKRNFSKDYASSSDDEKDHKKSKAKKEKSETPIANKTEESASTKLNRLLASMQTADDQMNFAKRTAGDVVAKPGEANKKKKLQQKEQMESKDIFAAAKKVASLLGDEKQQQQTESELLTKLLGGKQSSNGLKTDETSTGVSSTNENDISLSELIVGMKIDRRQQQKEPTITRSDYVRRSIAAKGKQQQYNKQQDYSNNRRAMQRKREAEVYTGSVNLFGGAPLGIFTDPATLKDSTDLLPTWSYLQEQVLKVQVSHPPSNYFDKMALWTEQGKIWQFPIDNEQDWMDEHDVDFSQHIFLDQHLESWCPNRGPVRHFMELVCVGLSKNPYITAKEKKDHIMWYREYFESKKDILRELMSKDPKVNVGSSADQQQVEA